MTETLVFSLVPEVGQRVRLDALESAIVEMRRLIRDIDTAVFRAEGVKRARRWYIERLSSSNPTIVLTPDGSTSPLQARTDEALFNGVQEIVSGESTSPPQFFSERELENLVDLRRKVLAKGLTRLELGTAEGNRIDIYPSIEDQVNRILRRTVEALGSLDGELDAVNTRKRPYFTIWEHITGHAVRCHFELDRLDEVKPLLRHRVRVSGIVRYFANGRPASIPRVEKLRDLGPGDLQGHRDFWASVPGLAKIPDTAAKLRDAYGAG
jgi:hypothetical protein